MLYATELCWLLLVEGARIELTLTESKAVVLTVRRTPNKTGGSAKNRTLTGYSPVATGFKAVC